MDKYITEASMSDSFIYQTFNGANNILEKIIKYNKNSVLIEKDNIEEQYIQMRKMRISPLSDKVLDAFDNKDIEILYSSTVKIGNSIPFIIRKNESGRIVATIYITGFTSVGKDGYLSIPAKQLYALLESAYVALKLQLYPANITRNSKLMVICMDVYEQIILKILNKDYALTLDKPLFEKVRYSIKKFFLTKLWGLTNKQVIETYAKNHLKDMSTFDEDMIEDTYDRYGITSVDTLFTFLSTLSPRLSEINIRFFIERYIHTYHGSSILAIDYLPYVFYVIINTILSSFLIGHSSLSAIMKEIKDINKFYVELERII